jgi:hypothetical protein
MAGSAFESRYVGLKGVMSKAWHWPWTDRQLIGCRMAGYVGNSDWNIVLYG